MRSTPHHVLVALHRVGPYHHARWRAIAADLALTILETRPASQEYPWEFQPDGPYPILRLRGAADPEVDPPRASLDRQLADVLRESAPEVVVSVGWADPAYQRLLRVCHLQRIPLVIVSDSRHGDEPRSRWKEAIKRQLLRGYSSALVAGRESRAYLEELGFPPTAIFQPWDVVDENLFRQGAERAPGGMEHFLCVSRFVAKKNLALLLQAYGLYQRQGGRWGLRLIGSGPLQAEILRQRQALPHPEAVRVDPFQQLEELPRSYGEATAFVLPSRSDQWGLVVNEAIAAGLPVLVSAACGCAIDLIEPEVSGWVFDPGSPEALAACLHQAERQTLQQRRAMAAAARARLERDFSLEAFRLGLLSAVQHATAAPRFSQRSRLTASLLSRLHP